MRVSGVEEETRGDPRWVAVENARRKALAVEGEVVLGADTDVALDGDILGKPADEAQALAFLERLSGRTHEVVGGIAVVRGGSAHHRASRSPRSTFAALDRSTVEWYVRSREWEGRAGGYAIQGRGATLIAGIRGDYLNVVGLPLARLLKLHPDLHPATPISRGSAEGRSVDWPPPRGTPRELLARSRAQGSSSWASSRTSPVSVAATWRSTSARPTPSSTYGAAASCCPSRAWSRSTRAPARSTRWGSRPSACSGARPARSAPIRPLKDGVIADFDVTEEMLRHFIQKVHQNRWAHPRVVVCVPSGVTGVEKRAVEEACLSAGARQAYLIEEPMAAAIGAGLPVGEPTGNMVVDIGGGTSEVAVISLGGIVVSQSIRVGGDELDEAIINYVKKEYKLLIGQQTAEEVKLEIGSAYPLEEEVQAEIRGRDLVSGLPKTVVLTSEEVRAALEEPLVQIIDAIKETLDRTPPELASDIMDRGIMLAGGGSLLQGIDERLREETQMPAHRAESPLTCVAVGSGRSLEEFEAIHRSNRNNSRNNRRPRR